MNHLMLLAACDWTDARTDPACYPSEVSTVGGHAEQAWAGTLDTLLHPALSWPGLIGVGFWLTVLALVAVVGLGVARKVRRPAADEPEVLPEFAATGQEAQQS